MVLSMVFLKPLSSNSIAFFAFSRCRILVHGKKDGLYGWRRPAAAWYVPVPKSLSGQQPPLLGVEGTSTILSRRWEPLLYGGGLRVVLGGFV